MRAYGEIANNKKAADLTVDDVMTGVGAVLSVFVRDPHFQGQTKDRLVIRTPPDLLKPACGTASGDMAFK